MFHKFIHLWSQPIPRTIVCGIVAVVAYSLFVILSLSDHPNALVGLLASGPGALLSVTMLSTESNRSSTLWGYATLFGTSAIYYCLIVSLTAYFSRKVSIIILSLLIGFVVAALFGLYAILYSLNGAGQL